MNNSLAEVHPELVSEWSEKNLTLTPGQIIEKRKIFGCVCQSIYCSQGRFIRMMNLKNRSGFSNGNLQNRSIFICKGMENKCLFLISIGIYNCYKIYGIKKGKE